MTEEKTVTFSTLDEWLAANPLYKWRGRGDEPKPMEYAARECSVSRTMICYWERGDFMPKHQNMIKVAALMKRNVVNLYSEWQTWLNAKPVAPTSSADQSCITHRSTVAAVQS